MPRPVLKRQVISRRRRRRVTSMFKGLVLQQWHLRLRSMHLEQSRLMKRKILRFRILFFDGLIIFFWTVFHSRGCVEILCSRWYWVYRGHIRFFLFIHYPLVTSDLLSYPLPYITSHVW
jgi:hypothetical protein